MWASSVRINPAVTALTRTFGAHSTASVCVRLSSPALAAPYAAVVGEGRTPLTLAMFTIDPPLVCDCITRFAACATYSGASRLSLTIASENRGDADAASAAGEPPALLTT